MEEEQEQPNEEDEEEENEEDDWEWNNEDEMGKDGIEAEKERNAEPGSSSTPNPPRQLKQ